MSLYITSDMDLFTDIGPVEAARRVREQIGDVATIVSVDMDVLEPGECPGVGFLETGENHISALIYKSRFILLQVA